MGKKFKSHQFESMTEQTLLVGLIVLAVASICGSNAIVEADPSGGSCPEGWHNHTQWCYIYIESFVASMTDAEAYCQSFGGHLASILNKKEEEFAERWVAGYSDSWIGLRQKDDSKGENVVKDFEWTDGSKMTNYSNFYGLGKIVLVWVSCHRRMCDL